MLNIFTFCTVRIVQEGEEAFAGPDSLVAVGLVDALDLALAEEAYFRMEGPALEEEVHDLMEED